MNLFGVVLQNLDDVVAGGADAEVMAGVAAFRTYLRDQDEIRLFVDHTPGLGHQASSVHVLLRLVFGLGYVNRVVGVYRGGEETLAKLAVLIPGFDPLRPGDEVRVGEARVTFLAWEARAQLGRVALGFAGGADPDEDDEGEEEDYNFATELRCTYFVRLQPGSWPKPQQLQFFENDEAAVDLREVVPDFEARGFYYPPPVVPDADTFNWFKANGPPDLRSHTALAEVLTTKLFVDRNGVRLMPVYGVRSVAQSLDLPAPYILLQLATAVLVSQATRPGPVLLVNFGEVTAEDFASVRRILGPEGFEDEIRTLEEAPPQNWGERLASAVASLRAAGTYLDEVNGVDNPRLVPLFGADTSVEALGTALDTLAARANGLVYLQLGALPAAIFNFLAASSGLPLTFEGEGTAGRARATGRPFLHLPRNESADDAIAYPTDFDYPDVEARAAEGQAAGTALLTGLSPLLPGIDLENAVPLDLFRSETARAARFLVDAYNQPLSGYFTAMAAAYNAPPRDRLFLALNRLDPLIVREVLLRLAAAPVAVAAGGARLKALYDAYASAVAEGRLTLAPGPLPAGRIRTRYVALSRGGRFDLSAAAVTPGYGAGGVLEKFTVTGTSESLGLRTAVSIVFTEVPGGLVASGTFTALDPWILDGVAWVGLESPGFSLVVNDAPVPAGGWAFGTVRGTPLTVRLAYPMTAQWTLEGVVSPPASLASFYALAGGVNLTDSLPAPLSTLAGLGVTRGTLAYEPRGRRLLSVAVELQSSATTEWQLLPKLRVEGLAILLTVQRPGDAAARRIAVQLTGRVKVGGGTVELSAAYPPFRVQGRLARGTIAVGDLLTVFLPGTTLPLRADVTAFNLAVTPSTGAFTVGGTLTTDWPISIGGREVFAFEQVTVQVSRGRADATGRLTAQFTLGDRAVPEGHLRVIVGAGYDAVPAGWTGPEKKQWVFDGTQQGSLSLAVLFKEYLAPDWNPPGTFSIKGLGARVETVTRAYEIRGETADWTVPFLSDVSLSAKMKLGWNPALKDKPAGYFGSLEAVVDAQEAFGFAFTVGVQFGPDTRAFFFLWEGVRIDLKQVEVKKDGVTEKQWVGTLRLTGYTLGSLVEKMVGWATGEPFGLSAPWNVLNSVKLDGLELSFNFTTRQVKFTVPVLLDLGFAQLKNVAIIYDPKGTKKVKVTLEGRFLWVTENPNAPLDWDATDPGSTPAPPGGGNKYLDLRLLALGQHVSVTGLTDAQTVQAAVAVLRGLKVPTRGRIPVGAKKPGETGQPFFAPESNWLIAADFGVLRLDEEKKPAALALSREALDALSPHEVAALVESGTAVEVVEGGWADADPSRPAASLGGAAGTVEVGTFARRPEGGDDDGAGDGDGGGDGLVPGGRLPVRVPLSLAAAGEKKPPKYMLQMSVIFNDPRIYALRIALDKDAPAAKIFKGLDFQIMYRRVTDTVGVYQAEIALPAFMRELSIGAYSITLPVFGIAVYTNGDFMIDVGFPWNQDFSRSFTIQGIVYPGIPLIGSAGFYFGKLSGDTASMVPKTTKGYFNPVIVFGLGLQVGVGKTIEKGILRAGFSVTVVGIVEGVIAKFNPYIPAATGGSPANQLQGDYYFWLQGTVGIIGRLFGAVDFAIIKAEVNVTVKLLAQITYESYADLTFSVIASVEISVSVEIDLGLFSFSIDFSFSARIKETFTLKNSGQAPWLGTGVRTELARTHARSLRALLAADSAALPLAWGNLQPATGAETHLTAWLAPALTAAGDGSTQPQDQKPAYVAMLFVQSTPPSAPADAPPTSFDALAAQAFRWAVAAATRPMTAAEVDDLQVEDAVLEGILAALADPERPLPISPEEAGAFMDGQFRLKLTVPTETGQANATVFPVPPPLTLSVPARSLSYAFRDFNELGDDYVRSLRTYFDALAVQVQPKRDGADRLRMTAAAATPDHSMAGFVFADYFRLLVRQMAQGARDALRAFQLPVPEGRSAAWIVEWVNANGSMRAVVNGAPVAVPFTLDVLFQGNADHALRTGLPLRIQDAPYPMQGAETLDGVAARFGGAFAAAALAERNASRGGVLAPGAVVRLPGREPYTVTPADTFASVAGALGVDVPALVRDGGLAAQAGLLAAFAGLVLPTFTHTTAAGDTLEGVARRYGMAVAGLAVAENGALPEPWTRGDRALVLAHLASFRVRELLAEAGRSGGVRQLGSMASRYLLAGLRLPTKGIRQKEPCACGNGTTLPEECGLYALTGQQFTLPAAVDATFSFSLKKTDDLKWVWLNGNATALELTVTLRAEDVARVDAVRAAAQGGVRPATRRLGGQRAFERTAGAYALSPVTPWRSAGTIPMTYGTPPAVPSLAVWSFPATLTDLPHPAADAVRPRFVPRLAVFDEATGTTRRADPGAYSWGLQLPVGIKRIPAVPGSPSTAWTYELSGAGEAATALLERLVRTLKKGDDSWAKGIYLLYPPSPAGNAREGLLSDAADRVSFFVSQVNLSTETHPEAGVLRANLLRAEAQPAGCWNTPGDFVRLLWENSVTRSGGYFLYYYNADAKGGLPDRVFNDRGEATLTVLLTFSTGVGENRVAPFMNCLVTAGAGDPTRSVLFAEADPVALQAAPNGGEPFEAFAARYYTDALSIVEDNPGAALRTGAKVRITDGVYEVRPGAPGGALADIARYFDVEADAIRGANPQIPDWSGALALFTAVRLPGKEAVAGTDRGGATLAALAAFYGAPLSALAAANQGRADLFAGALSVRTGPVVRTSTVAAGTVAVAAERTVPQVPAKPEPGNRWGELYLEKTYGLLGWRVAGNAWFGRSEQLGLPVGPADAGDPAAPRGAAPAKRAADDPWRYQQVVPAHRFAGGTPRPGEPERSPYAGLGGLLQVEFGWQDLYGNRMLSPLQRPDLDPASPLNQPPLPVGYADALVGPGGWPSVSFAWDVVKQDTKAVLRVELGFDPSQYTGNGTPEGDEKARQNALRDLRIYERLQLQLFRGAGEVAFALESSLLRAGAAPVDGTAVRGWVGAVAGFVADRARGGSTAQPPAALPLEQALAADAVNPAPVFELTATLVMARPREAALADFRDTPEVWRSAARVPPRAAGGAGEAVSLRAFALAFEDALRTDAARLKVASGVNRERTVRPGTAAPLWAVRVGTGPGAVAFRLLDEGKPWLYAPRPVSNTLRSRARVPIWNYETGTGIVIDEPGGGQRPPDRELDFGGVDVDVWLRQLLEAVDSVLSPEFTSPLGILSRRAGRDFLAGPGGLLDQKRALADVVQTLVIPVLRDQADPGTTALNAAREGFRQQLLVRLASAYTITGVVQFRAAVPGPVPQPGFETPRLFGIPTAREEAGAATDATLTAARVELRAATEQDPVHLTFMVSARGGAAGTGERPVLPLSLEYRATHLEQEIGKVPGIEGGYRASSWLAFVLPPAPGEAGPLSARLGSFEVPLVLRAFPTPPSLTAQDGTASGAVKDGGVGGASAWDYAFTFREDYHHAQDHTHLRVVYNLSERRGLRAFAAVQRDLFDTLAEWVTVGPAVRADLARWLAPIDPATTDETVFRNAAAALDAFTLLARDVARSWSAGFSRGGAQGGRVGGPSGPDTVEERYVEEERSHAVTEPEGEVQALLAVLRGPFDPDGAPLPPPLLAPEVRIPEWTAKRVAEVPDGYAYVYVRRDGGGVERHLRVLDGRAIPDRTVVVPGLNVLGRQDAWSASWIVRNAELIAGRPTADPFVYTTSEIRFASVLHPTLDHGEPIDVARIGGEGRAVRRPLSGHLGALLQGLFAPDPTSEQTLQLEVRYEFALNAGMPSVSLPVLLLPPATFTPTQLAVPEGGCPGGVTPDGSLPCNLAATVEQWFRANTPSGVEGVLRLDLTVMSRLTEQPMPLLRLRTLVLKLGDVNPPLPTRPG